MDSRHHSIQLWIGRREEAAGERRRWQDELRALPRRLPREEGGSHGAASASVFLHASDMADKTKTLNQ